MFKREKPLSHFLIDPARQEGKGEEKGKKWQRRGFFLPEKRIRGKDKMGKDTTRKDSGGDQKKVAQCTGTPL
jgi:hypothetical protein